MAHSRSAKKRIRQNLKARARNRWRTRRVKDDVKGFLTAVAGGDKAKASDAYKQVTKTLDQIASKGTIHKNAAARQKSRLAKKLNTMGTATAAG